MNSGKSELKKNDMLIVYAEHNSPRLQYILQTLFDSVGLKEWNLCFDHNTYIHCVGDAFINYSSQRIKAEEVHITPHSLLFENDINDISIECSEWNDIKIFFETSGDLPFDIFAASFYLVTRYEEYLPFEADKFGRFPHTASIAYKEQFLDLPLINIWMKKFMEIMKFKFQNIIYSHPAFQFIPTYDIDIAYRYKKNRLLNIGSFCKALIKFNFPDVKLQTNYWLRRTKDCYDIYDWLLKLHTGLKMRAIFFFLVSEKTSRIDRNVQLNKMHSLIGECESDNNEVGLHPSSQSSQENVLWKEKKALELVTQQIIKKSRQHYILLRFPATYKQLIAAGIKEDYSMGYSTINGFRASFIHPFNWFDLSSNQATDLKIYPFCFMDAASFSNQKHSVTEAYTDLQRMYSSVKDVDGCMVIVMHNTLLTEEEKIKSWRTAYENFIRSVTV
jgi:hypothetical protein